jgi:PAS domain S-box-containing protein
MMEHLLRSVLDHALDGIISIDDRGTVQSFNRAAERIFGYPRAEVVGQNVKLLMPEPFHSEHGGYIANYLRTGNAKIIGIGREVVGLRRDRSTFPMDLSISEFSWNEGRYFTGIVRDVSKPRKLEAQLRQAQKMEAVGLLAGGIAHDFNNLLTIISGYSDIVLTSLPRGDPNWKHLAKVQQAAERAASLTQQLLAFSRQAVLEPKVLDLNAIVRDSERLLSRLLGEDIRIATALDPGIASVRADPGQIGQVIMNLCINARDAMPRGGQLTLETANLDLDEGYAQTHPEVKPGSYVLLAITDTGSGMTPEIKARIFEPFFTTKGPGRGTGLGLATVYGIIRQSEGYLEVYSEVGIGTTFKVYLPAVVQPATEKSASPAGEASNGNETVLLVEDEEGVREIAALALTTHGYRVLEAGHGKDALQVAEAHQGEIDLLVTDVVMPELSGRQLAEELRVRRPGLKVLFLSGYTDDAIVRHGILQAEVAFLHKPFRPAALAKKVRAVLDQK